MPPSDTTLAKAKIESLEIHCSEKDLAQLQATVVAQVLIIGRVRQEEAIRSLFTGIALHRIKAALPYGKFGEWTKANLTGHGDRWVNYQMRLALVFIEKCRSTKDELLALPTHDTDLTIDTLEGKQRALVKKALTFVGELSVSELLEVYGIKDTKKIGGARTVNGADVSAVITDPQQLYLFARDEIGGVLERVDTLFLKENRLQYLVGHPDEIRGAVSRLREIADKVEAAAKKSLKK